MSAEETKKEKITPRKEQITYANVLAIGSWLGIGIMTVSYILYVTGIMPPQIDVNLVAQNWDKGVNEFMKITGAPDGWKWLFLLNTGDYLNFIGIALLALLTILCYLILLKGYIARKNYTFAVICILEVIVLSLAASGILGTGGH